MWIKCCSSSFAVGVATAHHMFPFTLSLASHLCVGVWVSLRLGLRFKSRTSPGNLASGFLHVVCSCYQVMSCYHVVFNTNVHVPYVHVCVPPVQVQMCGRNSSFILHKWNVQNTILKIWANRGLLFSNVFLENRQCEVHTQGYRWNYVAAN